MSCFLNAKQVAKLVNDFFRDIMWRFSNAKFHEAKAASVASWG